MGQQELYSFHCVELSASVYEGGGRQTRSATNGKMQSCSTCIEVSIQ